jgi:hypothetical protein
VVGLSGVSMVVDLAGVSVVVDLASAMMSLLLSSDVCVSGVSRCSTRYTQFGSINKVKSKANQEIKDSEKGIKQSNEKTQKEFDNVKQRTVRELTGYLRLTLTTPRFCSRFRIHVIYPLLHARYEGDKIPINFNNLTDFLLWVHITLGSSWLFS